MSAEDLAFIGNHVRIDKRGPSGVVNGLGALIGYAIVERETDEILQFLTSQSDPRGLVAQWDRVIGTKVKRRGA